MVRVAPRVVVAETPPPTDYLWSSWGVPTAAHPITIDDDAIDSADDDTLGKFIFLISILCFL
jgi:hypothetical protein